MMRRHTRGGVAAGYLPDGGVSDDADRERAGDAVRWRGDQQRAFWRLPADLNIGKTDGFLDWLTRAGHGIGWLHRNGRGGICAPANHIRTARKWARRERHWRHVRRIRGLAAGHAAGFVRCIGQSAVLVVYRVPVRTDERTGAFRFCRAT